MKKIILMTLILLSNILLVKAKELPTIEVGSYNALINSEITIPINIKNNTGFTFIGFKIDYDTNSLEYINSKIIGLDNFSIKEIKNNENNRIVMYALTLEEDNIETKDGDIAEIKFKVKDKAIDSDLKIEVTDFGKSLEDTSEVNTKNGEISVSNKVNVNDIIDSKDLGIENPTDYIWESSDTNIAEVDESGKITFKKDGEVTITQKDKDNKIINTKKYNVDKTNNSKTTNKKEMKHINIIVICVVIFLIIIILFLLLLKRKNVKKI